jgi:hypothetical protein
MHDQVRWSIESMNVELSRGLRYLRIVAFITGVAGERIPLGISLVV